MISVSDTQRCPLCGEPPIGDVTRQARAVWISDLRCDRGHIWIVKWFADA